MEAPPRRIDEGRVCAVVRDPATWAWLLVVLLALLPLREAFAATDLDDEDDDSLTMPMGAMPPMMMPGLAMPGAGGSVKRLSDNDMSCEAIYLEVKSLEKTNAARQQEIDGSTKAMTDAAQAMSSAGMSAGSVASGVGLLSSVAGLVPGVGGMVGGMVGSAVSSAASAAATASIRAQQKAMMDHQKRLMSVAQEHAYGSARAEHLTTLFLKRDCKASEVEAALKRKGVEPVVPASAAATAAPRAATPAAADAGAAPVATASATDADAPDAD